MRNALITAYDKEGIEDCATLLLDRGFIIHTTDGTHRFLGSKLKEEQMEKIKNLSELTGFAELFGGRVKSLHPNVFAGILARDDKDKEELEKKELPFFDLVMVKLYPFEKNLELEDEKLVELIDIGGITLIRAAAKNYRNVSVVVEKQDLEAGIEALDNLEKRKELMKKAFRRTVLYDGAILGRYDQTKRPILLEGFGTPLRYGENPHQEASMFRISGLKSLLDYPVTGEKSMSFNNYLDLDSLLCALKEMKGKTACVIMKHTNPCGIALGNDLAEAYRKALSCDPISAFGGVLGFTEKVDLKTAEQIGGQFLDIVAAPGFDEDALAKLREKKKRRIIDISGYENNNEPWEYRYVENGFLVQKRDMVSEKIEGFKLIAGQDLCSSNKQDVELAWITAKITKSNAVVLVKDGQAIGIGPGQTSRVDSAKIACSKAKEFGFDPKGSISASDAFLPFPDVLEVLHENGVKCLIEPGGSINDQKVIDRAKELEFSLYFTGKRHFRH